MGMGKERIMKLPAKYWWIILILSGILFRLWLVLLKPQPFVFDQSEYHQVALGLLGQRQFMYVSAYRMSGYPMLLALIYTFFGTGDTFYWIIIQALLDTLTALLVFLIGRRIFKDTKPAWISSLLYLFNPFTSVFAGVRLTEITAIFVMTVIIYLLVRFYKTKEAVALFLLGLMLSYLPQVRPGFLFFSLTIMIILFREVLIGRVKRKLKIVLLIIFSMLYLSFFIHNMIKNKLYFYQASPMTVDNLFVREFYVSLFVENSDTITVIPPQVNWIYQDYSVSLGADQKRQKAQKYINLAYKEIARDPRKFIASRIKKLWYVWEKHNLYPYENFQNQKLAIFIYRTNIAILFLSLTGMILFGRKIFFLHPDPYRKWFVILACSLFVYISVLHAFTITAERFSLTAYPAVFLFAGYAIWHIIKAIGKAL